MSPIGRIHSFQSMGAVDGPGLRYVVFMQGCPLRCAYCHNPDTWDFGGGLPYTPESVLERILRYRPYFGKEGGVTITGGEPLAQPDFVAELFRLLHVKGIHTALDTSCHGSLEKAQSILQYTDLVLADLKFLSNEEYHRFCGGSLETVQKFLSLTEQMEIPLWIRHVVVPGLTDGAMHIQALSRAAHHYHNLEKIELLPFRKLCLEKYEGMGISFPLAAVPETDDQTLECLRPFLDR